MYKIVLNSIQCYSDVIIVIPEKYVDFVGEVPIYAWLDIFEFTQSQCHAYVMLKFNQKRNSSFF